MRLDWNGNQVGVLLDFAGDAHVDVFVTDRHDHAADDVRVDLRCEMDGLVGLHEFLKKIFKRFYFRSLLSRPQLTFNCASNSLR